MLKVTLPDGSVLEFSRRVRPIDIAAEIGPRLAKATLAAEVDGQLVGADALLPDEGQVSPAAADGQGPRGPGHPATFVRPRDGPGGDAAVRGGAIGLRPDGRQRLLLRFPDGAAALGGGFSADRGRNGPDRQGGRAFRAGGDGPRTRRSQFCRDLGQSLKVEHLEEGLADEADGLVLPAGRVHRSLPRAARARGRRDRGLQAALGGRRLLERRRPAAAVAAALRHRLVQQAGPGRPSAAGRRGQAPRPPRAGQATGTVPDRSGGRLRAGPLAAQGGGRPPPTGELPLRRADRSRGYQPVYTPVIGNVHLYETSGPLSVLQGRASSRRSRWRTASGICCGR